MESSEAGMTLESFSSWNELAQLLYQQNNLSLDSGYKAALFSQGKSPEKAASWGLCCWPRSLGNTFSDITNLLSQVIWTQI